ncbi:hypothetical protein GUJ93_ZPchr0130g6535 [Zizania palustris]|uniref:PDZ domain-containing protein n=1 Tax=Zizania palustris TaxID=103762 RepID=A0A8J5REG5_ZIZPA|nr:hypothetical protein GUJ93_ZPchr0130g6535 [Zizania palustris]
MAATLSPAPAPSKHCSIVRAQHSPPPSIPSSPKTPFRGLSLVDRRWVASAGGARRRRALQVNARAAGAAKNIEVEVDKPLGLTLGQKTGGGVVITAVDSGGNAARAGLKKGDQVLYTSSFFGDELWPADKLGFTKTAIQAKPDSVYFVSNTTFALIVDTSTSFLSLLKNSLMNYAVHNAMRRKKRFAKYDAETGKTIGGALPPITVIVSLIIGIAGVGALLVYGLQLGLLISSQVFGCVKKLSHLLLHPYLARQI